MIKTVMKIDGMMCGMCEAHINDAIRQKFNVKKVTSSHSNGETVIISPSQIDKEALARAIKATGYTLLSVREENYEKKPNIFQKLFSGKRS